MTVSAHELLTSHDCSFPGCVGEAEGDSDLCRTCLAAGRESSPLHLLVPVEALAPEQEPEPEPEAKPCRICGGPAPDAPAVGAYAGKCARCRKLQADRRYRRDPRPETPELAEPEAAPAPGIWDDPAVWAAEIAAAVENLAAARARFAEAGAAITEAEDELAAVCRRASVRLPA